MFIDRETMIIPAAFGGAELKLAGTHPASFRPSERRRVGSGFQAINISP